MLPMTRKELLAIISDIDKPIQEALIDEHQVAEMLSISVATVRRWRVVKLGPPYRKIGRLVRYERASIEAWLKVQPSGGE